jgi:hypothetical protein
MSRLLQASHYPNEAHRFVETLQSVRAVIQEAEARTRDEVPLRSKHPQGYDLEDRSRTTLFVEGSQSNFADKGVVSPWITATWAARSANSRTCLTSTDSG